MASASVFMPAPPIDEDTSLHASPGVGPLRLLIGLAQGIVLYLLYSAAQDKLWPATAPMLFIPAVLLFVLCPPLLVASVGHLAWRRIAQWVGGAAVVVVLLGVYDGWRRGAAAAAVAVLPPSILLGLHLAAALFIGHVLVATASAERRRIASYPGYFDGAWKLAVQLVFSAGFTLATWLVLNLGSALFGLIGITLLGKLLHQAAFNIPVLAFAFSCAMHVTDVRPAIVRGIRGLLLVLLSWLAPVVALLVAGFVLSMPFTGLAPLWATRHASAALLGACAVLVIMINAAFQNGEAVPGLAAPVRWSARLAAVLLTPLVAIAAWALYLRVHDHGWTDERIVAAATTFIAACYALGYLAAALHDASLRRIAAVNIAIAFVVVGIIVALFSPLLDPARLSVNSQLARLAAGKVAADKFDYHYLRFKGERFGQAALLEMAARTTGADAAAIRAGASATLARQNPYDLPALPLPPTPGLSEAQLRANLVMWPQGTEVPPGLLALHAEKLPGPFAPQCLTVQGKHCDVFSIGRDDGKRDLLLLDDKGGGNAVVSEGSDGAWRIAGYLPPWISVCDWYRQQLKAGKARSIVPARRDLEIGGVVVTPTAPPGGKAPPACGPPP
jgi:hypothetical protein